MANNTSDFSKLKDKINELIDTQYASIYLNPRDTNHILSNNRNNVQDIIQKISNNNITNTGNSNMSVLYQKTIIDNTKSGKTSDLVSKLNDTLSDKNTMNNIISIYTQNTLVRDIDREIDMVCKYMPKLDDALDTRREHVLSADHFTKNSIVIKSAKSFNKTTDAHITTNIETIKEKYNIDDFLENKVYRPTDKYGESFVYIIPYRKAIETLLKTKGNTAISNMDNIPQMTSEAVDAFIESTVHDVIEANTEEIGDIQTVIKESVEEYSSGKNYSTKEMNAINNTVSNSCDGLHIEINKSRIIESALKERFNVYKAYRENGSLFFNEKTDTGISNSMSSNANMFAKSANERNSMAANGVTLVDDLNQVNGTDNVTGKLKIPGCVVKALDHEMVRPMYIDDICLGYFYIECDKKMTFEKNTYSSTTGGIRPGGVFRNTFDYYSNASNEFGAIKAIARNISMKIDAKFVNANQDLTKEIYSILKYNSTVDASGKISKITVTFIPPEDIVHSYFDLDPITKRGVSGLMRSLFPAKLFSALYISNVIQFLTRGFDKRVYYVRQTVDTNISGVLMNVINQIQKSNYGLRQIESMSNVLNMLGRFNDLVIPRSASGDSPIDFEVIPGQSVEIKNDLMNMLEEMAVNATDVPFEVIQSRQQVDYATHLTMTNTKFLQKIYNRQGKTQKIFSKILTKIYNYEYNMDNNRTDEIMVVLPPPIYLNATNTAQILSSVSDLSQGIATSVVNENNDPDLMNEFARQVRMKMVESLFPEGFLDECLDRAKLNISQTANTNNET